MPFSMLGLLFVLCSWRPCAAGKDTSTVTAESSWYFPDDDWAAVTDYITNWQGMAVADDADGVGIAIIANVIKLKYFKLPRVMLVMSGFSHVDQVACQVWDYGYYMILWILWDKFGNFDIFDDVDAVGCACVFCVEPAWELSQANSHFMFSTFSASRVRSSDVGKGVGSKEQRSTSCWVVPSKTSFLGMDGSIIWTMPFSCFLLESSANL